MGLDIRLPLGWIFAVIGITLAIYGFVTRHDPIYDVSMGVNVNLIWGTVMALFGLSLIIASMRNRRSTPE